MSSYTIPDEQRRQLEELQRQITAQAQLRSPHDMYYEMQKYYGQMQQDQQRLTAQPTPKPANPLILLLEMS